MAKFTASDINFTDAYALSRVDDGHQDSLSSDTDPGGNSRGFLDVMNVFDDAALDTEAEHVRHQISRGTVLVGVPTAGNADISSALDDRDDVCRTFEVQAADSGQCKGAPAVGALLRDENEIEGRDRSPPQSGDRIGTPQAYCERL